MIRRILNELVAVGVQSWLRSKKRPIGVSASGARRTAGASAGAASGATPRPGREAPTAGKAAQDGRGRGAETPSQIPAKGWKDIFWRVWSEFNEDRLMLIAAGATFYLLLALFPFLAAFVSLYGFVADPHTIAEHISFLAGVLPSGGVEVINGELQRLVDQDVDSLSFAFISGLVIALWSANSGVKSLFEGLNIAYDETEKRSFIRLNLLSLAFTLGAIMIGVAFIFTVGIIPAMLAVLRLDSWAEILIAVGRWPVMLAMIIVGITLIYHFGPSRQRPKLRWLTWGAVLASIIWIVASWGFSFYLQNFADYNATYGTLGAVIGFMIWTWISVTILLLGAEVNAEMEHQTAVDSTTGPEKPMGSRGAVMADTVGKTAEEH